MSATTIHEGRRLLAEVAEHHDLAPEHPDHCSLVLHAPWVAEHTKPGQFIHVLPPSPELMLRRPFSLLSADPSAGTVTILFRVIGEGTRLLAEVQQGETLDIIGPLGNGFPLDHSGPAVLVGGGVGIPPLVFLARRIGSTADVRIFLGAKDRGTLICIDDLREQGIEPVTATEDGSVGLQGVVTDALSEAQDSIPPDAAVFACGPVPMLKAVAEWSADRAHRCYVSLESKLACGIGACLGCSIPITEKDGAVHYERVCCDGPVFDADRVAFDLM